MSVYSHYTLHEIQTAHEQGNLGEWLQEYLRGEGSNHSLADILLERRPAVFVLQEFSLNKLHRVFGPEPGMLFSETRQLWERRVSELEGSIREGKFVPPLVVTDFWEPFSLADGSHRHEALLRLGYEQYWTIFAFSQSNSTSSL